jgi:hypothetical protein
VKQVGDLNYFNPFVISIGYDSNGCQPKSSEIVEIMIPIPRPVENNTEGEYQGSMEVISHLSALTCNELTSVVTD